MKIDIEAMGDKINEMAKLMTCNKELMKCLEALECQIRLLKDRVLTLETRNVFNPPAYYHHDIITYTSSGENK